ncbi:DUF5615 family PIN-like protein [Thermoflexibacter ruber]|uniref:DUF5615 domain-containing protein n=1 Tax=Thermoflexibacter ruber TaxID=1003 RepID=A0A1I2DJN0_9BACT|nr:DUF5615 family PIN-like protein [Thermoflexibacter ruber]SFE80100.1 hypothetical protein SAMN04488541_100726 [Thermoflexibacter ruber]
MKTLLLDENIPRPLKRELTAYQVYTIQELGWSGIEDRQLVNDAVAQNFDILITADKNLEYQQKISNLPMALIVIYPKLLKWEYIKPLVPQLILTIDSAEKGSVYHVYS